MAADYQRLEIERFLAASPPGWPLIRIVESAPIQAKLAAFAAADRLAITGQSRFLGWGRMRSAATTFGVLAGATLLLPIDQQIAGLPRMMLGVLQSLAVLATFGAIVLLMCMKPRDEWMVARAEAERLRGEIFKLIVETPGPPNSDVAALQEHKLDLLLAAHLDDQQRYFIKRIADTKRKASQVAPLRLTAYLLITCAATLGLVSGAQALGLPMPHPLDTLGAWLAATDARRWQLGMSAIASGLLAHATTVSLMDDDERRIRIYSITSARLAELIERRLGAVRSAIARGDETALPRFFAEARTILEQEHAVWMFARAVGDDGATRD